MWRRITWLAVCRRVLQRRDVHHLRVAAINSRPTFRNWEFRVTYQPLVNIVAAGLFAAKLVGSGGGKSGGRDRRRCWNRRNWRSNWCRRRLANENQLETERPNLN